ncbi:hypothetical protein CE91St43_02340 [Oscillospiraceae bacterium]|nr:hypothetical protein CE91St43_02340 [Oscillospiraceae bacterium]
MGSVLTSITAVSTAASTRFHFRNIWVSSFNIVTFFNILFGPRGAAPPAGRLRWFPLRRRGRLSRPVTGGIASDGPI